MARRAAFNLIERNDAGTANVSKYQPMDAGRERALLAVAASDDDAFRQLYDFYLPRVYAYVGYRMPPEETEDIVAEIFARMARGLGRFRWRGPGSFSAWLFRIAHNEVAGYHRRTGRAARVEALDAAADVRDARPPPDEAAESAERVRRVRRLVEALPPRRQEVILLKFFGGLPNREIAAILGLDERTVASHLCRALDDLERRLAETAGEGGNIP